MNRRSASVHVQAEHKRNVPVGLVTSRPADVKHENTVSAGDHYLVFHSNLRAECVVSVPFLRERQPIFSPPILGFQTAVHFGGLSVG